MFTLVHLYDIVLLLLMNTLKVWKGIRTKKSQKIDFNTIDVFAIDYIKTCFIKRVKRTY